MLSIAIMLLSSCDPHYAQIYTVAPLKKNISIKSDHFVFENDTIRVDYYFWSRSGKMDFEIANKYTKPIYIDWKKCSYIQNTSKNNYYTDETDNEYVEVGTSSGDKTRLYGTEYNSRRSVKKGSGVSVKAERIVFVPPGAVISKNIYAISNRPCIVPEFRAHRDEISSDGYFFELNPVESYLTFRNYLTYSTTENFEQEQYVDNGFFVSGVRTIYNDSLRVHYYKSPMNFYHIYLDEGDIYKQHTQKL